MSADNEKEMTDFSFPFGRPEEIPEYRSKQRETRDLRDAEGITYRVRCIQENNPKCSYRLAYRSLYELYGA